MSWSSRPRGSDSRIAQQQAEDGCREREPQTGAPDRVELAVAEADRDEVRAADEDGARERRES
jgi:hypothetical protein